MLDYGEGVPLSVYITERKRAVDALNIFCVKSELPEIKKDNVSISMSEECHVYGRMKEFDNYIMAKIKLKYINESQIIYGKQTANSDLGSEYFYRYGAFLNVYEARLIKVIQDYEAKEIKDEQEGD